MLGYKAVYAKKQLGQCLNDSTNTDNSELCREKAFKSTQDSIEDFKRWFN